MTYLELVTRGDKLRTVPERGCRLNCRTIYNGGNKEGYPAKDIVYKTESFHVFNN